MFRRRIRLDFWWVGIRFLTDGLGKYPKSYDPYGPSQVRRNS
jgi:hypothetical protein